MVDPVNKENPTENSGNDGMPGVVFVIDPAILSEAEFSHLRALFFDLIQAENPQTPIEIGDIDSCTSQGLRVHSVQLPGRPSGESLKRLMEKYGLE